MLRIAYSKEIESLDIGFVNGPTVDKWETSLAKDKLARLAEELGSYDFIIDFIEGSGKGLSL